MCRCYFQCGGVCVSHRIPPGQSTEDSVRVKPVSAAADDAEEEEDYDDDDDDGDDPFDIPEESDDLTTLARSSPDRKAPAVEKQTAELELESMSGVERKDKTGRGRRDSSIDGQSTPSSRTNSGRRKVSIHC